MKTLHKDVRDLLHKGTVIPAHPLALDKHRKLDERRQRALTRYYLASGAGGIAVGVHTTEFEIREPGINLLETVLKIASREVDKASLKRPFVKVAGICGPTEQALQEARMAAGYGYDLGLLSMGGLQGWSEEMLIRRVEKIAEILPVFGFYLQPAVGGKVLSFDFWKAFSEIPNVVAIKMAPFNRYQTLDVVRAVCSSSRYEDIALYTGNDDNIVADLLTTYRFRVGESVREKVIAGGLLGHWAVWTRKAVELLEEIKSIRENPMDSDLDILTTGIAITDANAAIFDPANNFKGCLSGIHEVLRRQGLLEGTWCLNPEETLSPGQSEEISRVYDEYPELNDDSFVREHLQGWLAE